jgi:hypothetical protein
VKQSGSQIFRYPQELFRLILNVLKRISQRETFGRTNRNQGIERFQDRQVLVVVAMVRKTKQQNENHFRIIYRMRQASQ